MQEGEEKRMLTAENEDVVERVVDSQARRGGRGHGHRRQWKRRKKPGSSWSSSGSSPCVDDEDDEAELSRERLVVDEDKRR